MDYTVHGVAELDATERLSLSLFNDKQVVHFMHNHARTHTHTHMVIILYVKLYNLVLHSVL